MSAGAFRPGAVSPIVFVLLAITQAFLHLNHCYADQTLANITHCLSRSAIGLSWFARVPPYVGFKKGEQTTAGGDGRCYVGFPKARSNSALVVIHDQVIHVIVQPPGKQGAVTTYKSKDGHTLVLVSVTGSETTCAPREDKCCGDYTYATIKVFQGTRSASAKAARYEGS